MLTLSFASEPTVKTHNDSQCKGIQRMKVTSADNTDSESTGPPKFNSGPPYSVGKEVLCEVNGMALYLAFVLEADHPRYRLRLHHGQEIDTTVKPAGLVPQYAPGYSTPDADGSFKDLRTKWRVKNGSLGSELMPS